MRRIEEDESREYRIEMEAVVDAYDSEERATGWYYYLDDKIKFPFEAICIKKMGRSPLIEDEKITALEMMSEGDYMKGMYVKIQWENRSFGVPLEQIQPLNADEQTREAIEDWHYWVARGYGF